MTTSWLIVSPGGVVMSFRKMHPGAEVEIPPWIRMHGLPSVGLIPDFVRMVKTSEVMGSEPVPPPDLITGSIGSATATAVDNTTNAANATIRSDFMIPPSTITGPATAGNILARLLALVILRLLTCSEMFVRSQACFGTASPLRVILQFFVNPPQGMPGFQRVCRCAS
jgi:hypothetical protein